jgi:hypothetical protein
VFCFVVGTPDELAGQVQKELDILNQMDMIIMKKLDTEESRLSEDVACTTAVSSTVLSQVLSKALREGISVNIWFVSFKLTVNMILFDTVNRNKVSIYINSLYFLFFTHYMFRPLRAIFR